jgi:hypothetical protein
MGAAWLHAGGRAVLCSRVLIADDVVRGPGPAPHVLAAVSASAPDAAPLLGFGGGW